MAEAQFTENTKEGPSSTDDPGDAIAKIFTAEQQEYLAAGRFRYPSILRPYSSWLSVIGWILTAIGTLVGIVLLIFPEVTQLSLSHRVKIGILSAGIPIAFLLIPYFARLVGVFCYRSLGWRVLHGMLLGTVEKLANAHSAINDLIRDRQNRHAYSIAFCYSYGPRTFIVLNKKAGGKIEVGRGIRVFDTSTGVVMGTFAVAKEEPRCYHCEKKGYVDPLWLGNIKQQGSQHSAAPPEALAVLISNDEGEEDE